MNDGTVRCWGMGEDGQLGDGAAEPQRAGDGRGTRPRRQLAIEGSRSCAVRDDGTVWCWGAWAIVDAVEAQCAADAAVPLELLRAVPERMEVWNGVRQLAIGSGNDCAVDGEGRVLCRGSNTRGGVGDGSADRRLDPAPVPGVTAVEVAVQMDSTCARTPDGRVLCWGWNDYCGQLGDGTKVDRLEPVEVPGLSGVTHLVAGSTYACAVTGDGALHCWGCNFSGQLGDGTTEGGRRRSSCRASDVRNVTSSGSQTCATLGEGSPLLGRRHAGPRAAWTDCPEPRTIRRRAARRRSWVIGPVDTYRRPRADRRVDRRAPGGSGQPARLRPPAGRHGPLLGQQPTASIGDGTGGGLDHDRAVPTPVAL